MRAVPVSQSPIKLSRRSSRHGKALVFVVLAIPACLGIVGLVIDVGLLSNARQDLQHAADTAATAAAADLAAGLSATQAEETGVDYVTTYNGHTDAAVEVNIPPASGPFAGRSGFVEVIASQKYATRLMQVVGGPAEVTPGVRAVGGLRPATSGAAVVVLDDDPPPIRIDPIPLILPLSFPAILGGLEVLGLGRLQVDGAVLVNTAWGGVDENGLRVGAHRGPPHAISCTPLLSLTKIAARDVRVVGGVDDESNFGPYLSGESEPLRANRLPVPDPFADLGAPTTSSLPGQVDTTNRGGVRVVSIPLILLPTVLRPGVYDWIEVISGSVIFQPGVYIIRGVNPITRSALTIAGGIVKAEGVLFYITNSSNYDPVSGFPDAADGEQSPPAPNLSQITPSVILSSALPGTSFSPISAPGSPFDGMLIYQRRADFRPMVVVYQGLLGNPRFDGTIYAKWGHLTFVGDGTHDMRVVAGSARFVPLLGLRLIPDKLLPPAFDVYLVE
jgi:hypothetical protein